jgi:hypothetical protein
MNAEICEMYRPDTHGCNLKKHNSAISVVKNVKKKLLKDGKLRKRVNELSQKQKSNKSQPES